jgi:hypothetical protein
MKQKSPGLLAKTLWEYNEDSPIMRQSWPILPYPKHSSVRSGSQYRRSKQVQQTQKLLK